MERVDTTPNTLYRPMKLPKCATDNKKPRPTHEKPTRDKVNVVNENPRRNSNDEHLYHETNKISRLVNWKLEYYFGHYKREKGFNVRGRYRTTSKLHKYDLMYKVTEMTSKENSPGKSSKNKKNRDDSGADSHNNSKSQAKKIRPNLSWSFVLPSEAKRTVMFANDLWDADKLAKLTSIQRYLPQTYMTEDEMETTRVLTHSRHPYAVLHADHYVQYCKENDLYGGNPKTNPRLLKLRKRENNTCGLKSSNGRQGTKTVAQKEVKKRGKEKQTVVRNERKKVETNSKELEIQKSAGNKQSETSEEDTETPDEDSDSNDEGGTTN